MEPQVARKLTEARRLLVASPDSADAWGAYGQVLHGHGLVREAATAYRQAETMAPDAAVWFYLESQAVKGLDPDRALAAVDQALALDDSLIPGWVLRAELAEHFETETLGFTARGGFEPDRELADRDVLETDDRRLEVLHTPGHASDHLCLYDAEGRVLFSGDLICHDAGGGPYRFPVQPGYVDLEGGKADASRLSKLPLTVVVCVE